MHPGGRWRVRGRRSYITAGVVLLAALVLATVAFAAAPFSEVSGSPFAVGVGPAAVAYGAGGKLFAVANNPGSDTTSSTVSMFTVGSGGGLTPVAGSPFPDDNEPQSIAFSPSGTLVATANSGGGTVSVYAVASDGSLSYANGGPVTTGEDPTSVAFSPDGKFLATVSQSQNSVSVFSVAADGTLTQVAGSPFPTGTSPAGVAFNPTSTLLATANRDSNTVSVFSVATNGALSAVSGSPFVADKQPLAVAFSPGGGLLVTANSGANNLSVFSVAGTGVLTQAAGSPVAVGSAPQSVGFAPYGGLLAAANHGAGSVSLFSFTSGGALTSVSGSPLAAGSAPDDVAFSPVGGLFAVPADSDDTVHVFSYPIGPPSVSISVPATGTTFTVGQSVTAKFSCAEGMFGPGLSSCDDSLGTTTVSGGSTVLDTSKTGTFSYTVTATSRSGQTASRSVSYQVTPAVPTPTPTPTPAPGGVTATISSLKTAGPVAILAITCAGPASGTCTGAVTFTVHVRSQGTQVLAVTAVTKPVKKKITTVETKLATAKFSVKVGSTKAVRVSLNAAGRKLLASLYRLKVTATFTHTMPKPRTVSFAYARISSAVTYTWHSNAAYSYETELDLGGLPRGAVIAVSCHGGGCPAATRPIKAKTSRYSLTKTLRHAHLRPGTRLTLTIEAPNAIAKVFTFVIRGSAQTPELLESCLPPGDHTPVKCHA